MHMKGTFLGCQYDIAEHYYLSLYAMETQPFVVYFLTFSRMAIQYISVLASDFAIPDFFLLPASS